MHKGARRNIAPVSCMLSAWGVEPSFAALELRKGGTSVAAMRQSHGLYFTKMRVRAESERYAASFFADSTPARALEACSAKRPFGQRLSEGAAVRGRLWAARLHLGSERALRLLPATTRGTGITKVNQPMIDAAQADTFIRRASLRRTHVERKDVTPPPCGHSFQIDAYGPAHAKSVIDGKRYHMHGECTGCGFAYDAASSKGNFSAYAQFGDHIIAEEAKLGHQVRELRIDATPQVPLEKMQAHFEPRCSVTKAAGGFHDHGIPKAEAGMDPIGRAPAAAIARAGLSRGFEIPSRCYASRNRNFKVSPGTELRPCLASASTRGR